MPNLPISGLPAGAAVTGTDPFPTEQAGVTVQVSAAQLAVFALAQLGIAHPGYVSGRWYSASPRIAAGAALTVAADTIYYTPLMIYRDTTIDALSMRNSSTNAVAANANLAIYDNVNGAPDAKLFDVASAVVIPATANTGVTAVIGAGAQALTVGCYWIAIQYDGGPSIVAGALGNSIMGYIGGTGNSPSGYYANSAQEAGYTEARAYGLGLPANATPVSTGGSNLASAVIRIA